MMEENLKQILKGYTEINSKIFTHTRLLLLNLLKIHWDGLQFRELSGGINISDGNLYSNLEILKSMELIESEKIQIDNKVLEVYSITEKGLMELGHIGVWLEKMNCMVK